MKKVAMFSCLAVAFTTALAGVARADTTLGSTAVPDGSGAQACGGDVIAQTTSDPSTPYTVPTPPVGPLTSWQVSTVPATAGDSVTLVVLRSTGPSTYTVVGADTQGLPSFAPTDSVVTFTVPAPIAVSGGDILALYSADMTFGCFFQDGATPAEDLVISLNTAGTPVAGQDLTLEDSSGPGFRLNLAATLTATATAPTPVPAKKRCKKHKKKRSADSAKKKKCKKKKKH